MERISDIWEEIDGVIDSFENGNDEKDDEEEEDDDDDEDKSESFKDNDLK